MQVDIAQRHDCYGFIQHFFSGKSGGFRVKTGGGNFDNLISMQFPCTVQYEMIHFTNMLLISMVKLPTTTRFHLEITTLYMFANSWHICPP